jgi:hypothetical protein
MVRSGVGEATMLAVPMGHDVVVVPCYQRTDLHVRGVKPVLEKRIRSERARSPASGCR